jgi:pyruvate-formate lyase-activating enzyme
MKKDYPIVGFKHECFQEFKDEISLILWCWNCNMHCSWCSMKNLIYDKKNIINLNYIDLIKNHTKLESAVVFLGGEPTIYPIGLYKGAKLAKSLNLKTKFFTNGKNLNIICDLVSKNLFDAISIDYKYQNQNIYYIINMLNKFKINIDIRITKYPELSNEDYELMLYKVKTFGDRVNLFIQKFQKFGE